MPDVIPFSALLGRCTEIIGKIQTRRPVLPRKRKVPAMHDGQEEHHFSANPEDHYRALYFQTLDDVIMGLTTQFEPTESSIHLSEVEKFIIGECDVSYIKDFYKYDFEDMLGCSCIETL